jgi:hypothetical protein
MSLPSPKSKLIDTGRIQRRNYNTPDLTGNRTYLRTPTSDSGLRSFSGRVRGAHIAHSVTATASPSARSHSDEGAMVPIDLVYSWCN